MAEGLERKKRVREAHRGAVTRIITQIRDNLGDEPNIPRLQLQKKSLLEKAEILAKLDHELIDLVDIDDLDREVEQVDDNKERIDLAIIDVDLFLDQADRRDEIPSDRIALEEARTDEPPEPSLPTITA